MQNETIMTNRNKATDPIPAEFDSYESAAEFWDQHDTTDYLAEFETIDATVALQQRHFEVEVDEDVLAVLRQEAKRQSKPIKQLVSELLRKQLPPAA